ncbi:hypothetical protein AcV7_008417 [Taiwanofungus camphoratus]|nr:hypothetical protein AcV7_008417 [Antrodia cinnamomea]
MTSFLRIWRDKAGSVSGGAGAVRGDGTHGVLRGHGRSGVDVEVETCGVGKGLRVRWLRVGSSALGNEARGVGLAEWRGAGVWGSVVGQRRRRPCVRSSRTWEDRRASRRERAEEISMGENSATNGTGRDLPAPDH